MCKVGLIVGLIFVHFICTFCNRDNGSKINTVPTINITDNLICKNIKLSGLITDYKFIPLETREDCMIGQIDKIIFHDDKFYILDSRKAKGLFVFSIDGKFIHKISKTGRGPGEFNMPRDFCFEPKTNNLVVLEYNFLKYFKEDGTYIKTLELPFQSYKFTFSDENHIIFYTSGNEYDLIITNSDGKIDSCYFKSVKETKLVLHVPFIKTEKDGILYITNLDYKIYKIIGNQITPHTEIRFEKDMYTPNDLALLTENRDNVDKFYTISYYFESPNNIFILYFHNRVPFYLCYNKMTKKTIIAKYDEIENDITFTKNLPSIRAVDTKDTFISQFDVNTFIAGINEINDIDPKLEEILKTSSATDNPILFLFKFR